MIGGINTVDVLFENDVQVDPRSPAQSLNDIPSPGTKNYKPVARAWIPRLSRRKGEGWIKGGPKKIIKDIGLIFFLRTQMGERLDTDASGKKNKNKNKIK